MPGALDGVRVLDNGIVQAGTFPARLLADYGAEIIRVEHYRRPDLGRNFCFPDGVAGDPYWEQSGIYLEQHRNKAYCVGLDAGNPRGRELFLRLVASCDIVLDSHPPGLMEDLGLGYEDLRAAREDLVYVSTSGYGYGGPYSEIRSYGMMSEVMSGISSLNGYAGEAPQRGTIPLTDHPATYHIAFLMVAALERRDRTGKGAWVDVSQYEVGVNLIGDAHVARAFGANVPGPRGNGDDGHPIAGCVPCDDGSRWLAIDICDRAAWDGLRELIEFEALDGDRDPWAQPLSAAEQERIREALEAWARTREGDEAVSELQARGVPAAVAANARDLLLDPHLEARGFFWLVDHAPEQGAGRRAWPGASALLSRTPAELRTRAPMLGEHNHLIATGLLGCSEEEYEEYVASGAMGVTPDAAEMKPPPADLEERLHLPPAAQLRIVEFDPRYTERMMERFGDTYGSDATA